MQNFVRAGLVVALALVLVGAEVARGPVEKAGADYEAQTGALDGAYWEHALKAREVYVAGIEAEFKRAMDGGDLPEANRLQGMKSQILGEVAKMEAGEALTVGPPGAYVVASAGFNVHKGMNVIAGKVAPYGFGDALPEDEKMDVGWTEAWQANRTKCVIDAENPMEGDGSMRMNVEKGGETLLARRFKPQTGRLQIVESIRSTENTGWLDRPGGEPNNENFGPDWGVSNGEFWVMDGVGSRAGNASSNNVKTGMKFLANTWYTVTLTIDVPSRTWEFAVDGKTFAHKPLGFRGNPVNICFLDFLPNRTFWVDNIQIIHLPDVPAARPAAGSARAVYEDAMAGEQRAYWDRMRAARVRYSEALGAEIMQALNAEDLAGANKINAEKGKVDRDILRMDSGEPLMVAKRRMSAATPMATQAWREGGGEPAGRAAAGVATTRPPNNEPAATAPASAEPSVLGSLMFLMLGVVGVIGVGVLILVWFAAQKARIKAPERRMGPEGSCYRDK